MTKNILKSLNRIQATEHITNFVKIYPTGKIKVYKFEPGFDRIKDGLEPSESIIANEKGSEPPSEIKLDERSLRRSKTRISDYVLSNNFEMFATFTFSTHRQNMQMCKSRMHNWLKSQQKLHGKFQYIIVPEFHKDGKSLHFHALMNDYKGNLKDSGKLINNRQAYNILSYQNGFSTVVYIDNQEKVASYIKKYITKDMPKLSQKKRYWHSTKLQLPTIQYNADLKNFDTVVDYQTPYFTLSSGTIKT